MTDFTQLDIDPDDRSWVPTDKSAGGHVDVGARLSTGGSWHVTTDADTIHLAIAGGSIPSAIKMSPSDIDMLTEALRSAERDINRTRRGDQW